MGASYGCDTGGGQKQLGKSRTATFSLEVAVRALCVQPSAISRPPRDGQPCKINIPPSHQHAAHGTVVT